MNNSIETCLHSKNCARYEHQMCSNLSYMSSCRRLNDYLINKAEEDLRNKEIEEHQDHHTDMGLIARLKR